METVTRPVHPALQSCLAEPMVAYDIVLPVDAVHVGVPSTAATVIIAVEEPLDVGWLHEPNRSTARWCSISGLHLRPALIHTHGLQRGIHLAVTPIGCRALFGAPIGSVATHTVDMDDLPRGLTCDEHESIASRTSWTDRLAAAEAMLLTRLNRWAGDPTVTAAWRLLGSGLPVAEVAAEIGYSRRHLRNRVRAEFGLTPKEISLLARFENAQRLVASGASLTEAASSCGYADQSHLSREWKRFVGGSPKARTEDFPNLQDLALIADHD
ncbi:helix-turn-helix domain-containing protein [Brevibacterium luteolum]|uniref:Helix-turn-helix transcriptional regulator n=1 Tax=Brevibacterium luteolum TaxID=199591 RepID=A0A849AT00_9MICO|nr:helix-turn-helix transcriptional regulator [Brevibacterium luteolum]MBM7528758.1 AraC-like DNA-binding protein [Brevibacterium luteolum]MCT1657968.1 helix-turn-helix transcriptional regulator [Brevibacterium luteolum]NNG79040.1 helix-turn-helix transcriptional regulator [Brevibacterium luteolum]